MSGCLGSVAVMRAVGIMSHCKTHSQTLNGCFAVVFQIFSAVKHVRINYLGKVF